jgi:hypothetical protein
VVQVPEAGRPQAQQRVRARDPLGLRYVDVTDAGGPAAPHQDQVRALEELGYRQCGLVRVEPVSGGFPSLADDYAPDERAEMLEHLPEPHTLLRSPDGLVLARVGWFWSWPSVDLCSFMSDGARVETQRRWDEMPPWPVKRAQQRRFATVEGEMTRSAARGRSFAVVDGADARRIDEAHRAHVQAYADVHGCTPVPAPTSMDEVVALSEHAYEHALKVARRYARVGNVVVVALVIAAQLAFMYLLDALAARWWVNLIGAVLLAVASLAALAPFAVRFAYTRWWRPAYRPPAA